MDESNNNVVNSVHTDHQPMAGEELSSLVVDVSGKDSQPGWQVDRLPWSRQKRIKFFITGVLLPGLCISLSLGGEKATPNSAWQSGAIDVYAGLLLGRNPLLCFMPFLVFSMISMSAACIRPNLIQRGWIRLGIWTGMLLNFQYTILLMVAIQAGLLPCLIVSAIFAGGLALIVYLGSVLAPENWQITMGQILLLTTLVAIVAMLFRVFPEPFWHIGSWAFISSVLSAPALSLVTYSRAAIRLGADFPANPRLLLPGLAWLTGWFVAWRYAVMLMLDEYSKLPTTAPGCYVSAAAAHGHPAFVGTFSQPNDQGVNPVTACQQAVGPNSRVPVNLQMCRLKFLEFAIKAASPHLHRVIRSIYDRIGPPLAVVCRRNVWLADTAFLSLKPVELLAQWIQQAARVQDQRLRRLYH